ncbi:unnamed protein product [Sphagnum balticum]
MMPQQYRRSAPSGRKMPSEMKMKTKAVLEDSLYGLGVEKLNIEEVQKMPWDIMEDTIRKWIQVFPAPISETCFNDVANEIMMQLLSLSKALATGQRSPEKFFKVLDMHESLRDLLPKIENMFSGVSSASLKSKASGILLLLEEAATGTFAEFESAIQRDGSRTLVPGGVVHPLSWLIHVLHNNLDGKSTVYTDPALTYLFLMNNIHYIMQTVKYSNVIGLRGNDWGIAMVHNKKDNRYNEKDAARIVRQMLNVVARCHLNRVVHRDMKLENFLFKSPKEDSPLKAIDFGLSDYIKPGKRFHDVVGSAYVAPKVLKRKSSPESDVWSIGVITYILLCGKRPFWDRTKAGIFNEVLKKKPNFRDKPWPTINANAKDFVKKLLVRMHLPGLLLHKLCQIHGPEREEMHQTFR